MLPAFIRPLEIVFFFIAWFPSYKSPLSMVWKEIRVWKLSSFMLRTCFLFDSALQGLRQHIYLFWLISTHASLHLLLPTPNCQTFASLGLKSKLCSFVHWNHFPSHVLSAWVEIIRVHLSNPDWRFPMTCDQNLQDNYTQHPFEKPHWGKNGWLLPHFIHAKEPFSGTSRG